MFRNNQKCPKLIGPYSQPYGRGTLFLFFKRQQASPALALLVIQILHRHCHCHCHLPPSNLKGMSHCNDYRNAILDSLGQPWTVLDSLGQPFWRFPIESSPMKLS